jgi:DNA polymerase III epsilon subunit family exonuclease
MDTNQPVHTALFCAIDFETTGLYPATDGIVEFGAVRFRGDDVLSEYDRLSNPGVPIGREAGEVSGISDADIADAPAVEQVLPSFLEFVGDSIIIAHNAPFDVGFLQAAMTRAGLPPLPNLIVDTQVLAIKAFPRRKSYGLQNLATELNLPANRAHRAKDDALMCMRLFLACVEAMSFMGDLPLSEVINLRGPA